MNVKHFIEYNMNKKSGVKEVGKREVNDKILSELPASTIAFRFFTKEYRYILNKERVSDPVNIGPWNFIGQEMHGDAPEKIGPCDRWVMTRSGPFALEPDEKVIDLGN